MILDDKTLGEILLKGNYVLQTDLESAQTYLKTHEGSLANQLIKDSSLSKDIIGQAIAEHLGVPYSNLNFNVPSSQQVARIPEEIARKHRTIFFTEKGDDVVIATDRPEDTESRTEMERIFPGKKIALHYSLTGDINAALLQYRKPLDTRFSKIIAEKRRIVPEMLEEIYTDAFAYNASDIHFEPKHSDVLVRFRIDGVLHEAGRIPKGYYENVLNRVKGQSNLRTDEHFTTQDGSMLYQKGEETVNMRVSIVPTIEGEKIVLRVLGSHVRGLGLSDLGLSPAHQELMQLAARKPFGMILVTGPTGSGKTTTLYAVLKLLNSPEENITTIEDPVEYRLDVNQIQVNLETGLTFAKGLRSIVRQDPDTILVGEIRDQETAEIAVNAALTGHLLLSTFHANDAATAIPRLLDMGIEPFLLASTLDVVVAQRLVRKICGHCRQSKVFEKKDFESTALSATARYFLDGSETVTLYEGRKCETCNFTGYRGRIAIFEFIHITPEIQNLILKSPSIQEIWKLALAQGSRPMFEDGIEKVRSGMTTIEELMRVAEVPEA